MNEFHIEFKGRDAHKAAVSAAAIAMGLGGKAHGRYMTVEGNPAIIVTGVSLANARTVAATACTCGTAELMDMGSCEIFNYDGRKWK